MGGGILPLAAVLTRPDLDVADHLALGHYTHEKNPVLCRAALATLDTIVEEGLAEAASELGRHALERLQALADSRPVIGNVRGLGLLVGVELVRRDGSPAPAVAEATLCAALRRGLSFKVTMGNVLTLSPPLVVTRAELDRAIDIVAESVDEAAQMNV